MMCDVASGSGVCLELNVEAQLAHLLSSLSTLHFQRRATSIWYISTFFYFPETTFNDYRQEDDGWDRLKRGLGRSVQQKEGARW